MEAVFGETDASAIPEEFLPKAKAAGSDVPQAVDYFAAVETHTLTLPDGVQTVTLKTMTEGDRRRYLSKVNQEVVMNATTKDMKLKGAAGEDKAALIDSSVVDWYVFRDGKPLPFNAHSLKQALDNWPPSVIDVIVEKIREVNPWLNGTVEDLETLREEREDLDRRIEELEAKAAKNSG
jgi:hypothetical protein